MKIELLDLTVRDLVDGYEDKSKTDVGVVGYGGKLDIRPPFQRGKSLKYDTIMVA